MSLQINNNFYNVLPDEVWTHIFSFTEEHLSAISCVSQLFNRVLLDSLFIWESSAKSLHHYPKEVHLISSESWKKDYLKQVSRKNLEKELIHSLYTYVKFSVDSFIKNHQQSFWTPNDEIFLNVVSPLIVLLEKLAKDNKIANPQLDYYLALSYWHGIETTEDYHEEARDYLTNYIKQAENSESSKAQYILGTWYEQDEEEDSTNLATAIEHYHNAANHNNVKAQCRLGFYYQIGKGVPIHLEKAFEYYSKAANQTHPLAQYMVGRFLQFGLGTEKNVEQAFQFYLKAANQGNIFAQYAVGLCYKNGIGTAANRIEAEFYCKKVWNPMSEDERTQVESKTPRIQ